ncbi:hypothetical protein KKC45_02825 [Patescibacteria group bacterium]|nr:hypothetical protein [Patescibacteria group bacterium]
MRKITKDQLKKMQKARREAQPKLAVKLTDELEIWMDERNYILKNDKGDVLGYFGSLVPLIWDIFHEEFKLSLKEKAELEEIVKKVDMAEKYIRSLAKKLEGLQQLG